MVIGCSIHSICTTHTIQFIQNSDIRNYRYIAWFLAGAAAAAFIYLRCGKVDTYMHLRGEIGWAELFQMKSCVLLIGSDETIKVIFALASHFDPKRLSALARYLKRMARNFSSGWSHKIDPLFSSLTLPNKLK